MRRSRRTVLLLVLLFMMRRRGCYDSVVNLFANDVDSEGDEGGAEARQSVTEILSEHRMFPPFVSPLEELSGVSQLLPHFRLWISDLFLNCSFFSPAMKNSQSFDTIYLNCAVLVIGSYGLQILGPMGWIGPVLGCTYGLQCFEPSGYVGCGLTVVLDHFLTLRMHLVRGI